MLPQGSRRYFWWHSIARPTYWVVALMWALFSNAATFRDNFLDKATQSHWQTLDWLPKWGWRGRLFGLFVIAFVAMCEGTYRLYRRESYSRIEADSKLKEINDARPRIVVCDVYSDKVSVNQNGVVVCIANVLRAKIENDPPHPYPNSEAKNVTATVSFYDPAGNLVIADMDARWTASTQPVGPHTQSIVPLLGMDFPIGAKRDLDIVFAEATYIKMPLSKLVALNNDNFRFPGWRKPEHILPGARFVAEIHVSAVWVDTKFSVEFWVEPHGEIGHRLLNPLASMAGVKIPWKYSR